MNGTEQKAHQRVTDALDKRLGDLELIVTALDERVSAIALAARTEIAAAERDARELINAERTHRLNLAKEQRTYVDGRDIEVQAICLRHSRLTYDDLIALRDRGFWGRLSWLIRGA